MDEESSEEDSLFSKDSNAAMDAACSEAKWECILLGKAQQRGRDIRGRLATARVRPATAPGLNVRLATAQAKEAEILADHYKGLIAKRIASAQVKPEVKPEVKPAAKPAAKEEPAVKDSVPGASDKPVAGGAPVSNDAAAQQPASD